jgi:hypothetical protein
MGEPQKGNKDALLKNAKRMLDDGFPVDAVPYYCEAAAVCLKANDLAGAADCYERVAYCYELDGRWSDASEWYRKAQEAFGDAGDSTRAAKAAGSAAYAKENASKP